jgi:hypothetical protein
LLELRLVKSGFALKNRTDNGIIRITAVAMHRSDASVQPLQLRTFTQLPASFTETWFGYNCPRCGAKSGSSIAQITLNLNLINYSELHSARQVAMAYNLDLAAEIMLKVYKELPVGYVNPRSLRLS